MDASFIVVAFTSKLRIEKSGSGEKKTWPNFVGHM